MLIQITEQKYKDTFFTLELKFEGIQSFTVELLNPHTNKAEENLEWYFEKYIIEPYTADAKVKQERERLKQYGIRLFEQLFKDKNAYALYKRGLNEEGFSEISFEIIGDKSPEFQRVLWESLFDPDFNAPLLAKDVCFSRKSLKPASITAKVNSHPQINLLLVTARPSEDADVNYRTIQGPLMKTLEGAKARVNTYILRPGTYKSLKKHLQEKGDGFYHIIHFDLHGAVLSYDEMLKQREKERMIFAFNHSFSKASQSFQVRWGRYDIEPFEGKKAFLLFESDEKGVAEPAEAKEIAGVLQQYRLPVCILNACQSAKQDGIANETSLGKYLQEEGIDLVLAMRYSISVTAATKFMEKFYNTLFGNRPIEEAVAWGRSELYNDKNRQASLGYTIELEDWVLPVVYQRKAIQFNIRDFEPQEEEEWYIKKSRTPQFIAPQYGFFGRDLDILKIEKSLTQHNHLLLKGMVGVGKSTLLKYLSVWWIKTNFRGINNVIYIDWRLTQDKGTSYIFETFMQQIAKGVWAEKEYKAWINSSTIIQKEQLKETLNTNSYCIIVDNIFELKDREICSFLQGIEGKSFVVYGSVNEEADLAAHTFKHNIYQLDGLDKEAAYALSKVIIKQSTNKDLDKLLPDFAQRFDFEQLQELLQGFPSALEMVLPFLKNRNIETLLNEFRDGNLPLGEE